MASVYDRQAQSPKSGFELHKVARMEHARYWVVSQWTVSSVASMPEVGVLLARGSRTKQWSPRRLVLCT